MDGIAGIGLKSQAAVAPDAPRNLEEAAESFEALFLGNLLKAAREASQSEDADQAGGTMMEYAEEFLARAIAKGGGCGLGKMIVEQTKGPPPGKGERA